MTNKIYEKITKFINENIKFLITLILIVALFLVELPYAIYTPGGKVDLSKRVVVENGYETKGELDMAYVSMVKSSIPFVLLSFVISNWDLQKESEVTYDDLSMEETIEIDRLYMQEGINNAIISAYNMASKSCIVKSEKLKVVYVDKKSKSNLKIGDEILLVENVKPSSIDDIKDIIKNKDVKDKVSIKIKRDGKEKKITSELMIMDNEIKLGIATISLLELDTDPKVEIKTKKSESGSSGGLMTALAIYNSLIKEDITHGDIIIGTGTIDSNGNVGEIDGVKYKLLGAAKKKADVFLCPEKNYEEALKIKEKNHLNIELKSVKTLDEAIKYLESRE